MGARRGMSPQRILVIDDDPTTLELMTDILVTEGYAVSCASEVDADLRQLFDAEPQLLIVDLLLSDNGGDLSGWEIVRLVKSHRELRNLQVLVVSADYPSIRSHITEAAGMDGVRLLTKPFSLDSLSVLVRDALRGPRAVCTGDGSTIAVDPPDPTPQAEVN